MRIVYCDLRSLGYGMEPFDSFPMVSYLIQIEIIFPHLLGKMQ